MAADLKTAASAILGVGVNTQLGTGEATIIDSPGVGTKGTLRLTNTDTVPRTPLISQVKAGGTGGAAGTRIFARALTAGESAYITFTLGDGDFLSGKCTTAAVIDTVVDDVVFSSSGAALTGIQDDAIGTGGHGTATVTGTNKVATANNRYLLGALMVQEGSATTGWAGYTGLSMTCNDGSGALAMTRLVSIDFTNSGGGVCGSVHLFGRANPTSGSTQTLTGAAAASGATMNLVLASKTYSGVASVTGAVSAASGAGASALSLAITSAVGHVPVFGGLFFDVPQDFAMTGGARQRYFNGITSAFTIPKWLLFADALGAATVTASTSNSTQWAAVGADFVPA